MEYASLVKTELKDLDSKSGVGTIMHSVYNSVDLSGDIANPGMFNKSWAEAKASNIRQKIGLLFDHDTKDKIGYVTDVYEDGKGGYTEFKLFESQIRRISEYADNDIITGASFGYHTIKKDYSDIKGKRIRNLREVKHLETSLLDVQPCHPQAALLSLKSLDEISDDEITDLLEWSNEHITSLKSYVQKIEAYCHKAKASDDTIISLQNGLLEYKQIISSYDTAITQFRHGGQVPIEPTVSEDDTRSINNFLNSLKLQRWQNQ